jgi:hypothetical protein
MRCNRISTSRTCVSVRVRELAAQRRRVPQCCVPSGTRHGPWYPMPLILLRPSTAVSVIPGVRHRPRWPVSGVSRQGSGAATVMDHPEHVLIDSTSIPIRIVRRIRGEVEVLTALLQVSRHVAAVCKTVGQPCDRWSVGQSNRSSRSDLAPEWPIWTPCATDAPNRSRAPNRHAAKPRGTPPLSVRRLSPSRIITSVYYSDAGQFAAPRFTTSSPGTSLS